MILKSYGFTIHLHRNHFAREIYDLYHDFWNYAVREQNNAMGQYFSCSD